MNPVFSAALNLQKFCQSQNWKFCFIGGIAVHRWAEPRLTKDADLTLLTGFGEEDKFIHILCAKFKIRRPDAAEFALQSRVLLLKDDSGIPFDIALGALPFEEHCVARATPWKINEKDSLITCCAEDLIVHKAFASREIDWADIEKILLRHGKNLDFKLVWNELEPLIALKESPEIKQKLQQMLKKLSIA